MAKDKTDRLLALFKSGKLPTADEFRELVSTLENHQLLAKVFVLEGTPFVFKDSPMKYTVFREQVADQFEIGSQDVCIVGSAKLGFSPSPHKYGKSFEETSDVDVVVVSFDLFDRGSRELFSWLNHFKPSVRHVRDHLEGRGKGKAPIVDLSDWKAVKESIRNFTYQNFNPGLLPPDHGLRNDIFEKISSTSGLFCALEPQVFVSKIRARIFRNWKAAEQYYSNSLRELKRSFEGDEEVDEDDEDAAATFGPSGDPQRAAE